MTISPAFLDELRNRVALSGVVGRAVKLVRAGREWKACCPFHNEKTPSFYVNDDKGFRSEEHTSELQSLMRISYAVFCLKKKNTHNERKARNECNQKNEK